jgi:Leucine-rich repeat (LRR) protein
VPVADGGMADRDDEAMSIDLEQDGDSSHTERTRISTSIDPQIAPTSSPGFPPSQGGEQAAALPSTSPLSPSHFFNFNYVKSFLGLTDDDDVVSQDDDLALLNSPPRLRRRGSSSSHSDRASSGVRKNSVGRRSRNFSGGGSSSSGSLAPTPENVYLTPGKNKTHSCREKKQYRGGGSGGRGGKKNQKKWDVVENLPGPSSLPEEIKNPVHLRTIRLCDYDMSIPPNLCELEILTEMDAQNRGATPGLTAIPEVFFSPACKFRNILLDLDLSKNSITAIPSGIGSLANLQRLNLSANKIDNIDAVSNGLFDLMTLQHLDLSQNNLDKIPNTICRLSSLTSLDVQHQDSGLRAFPPLCCFGQLRTVNLSRNKLKSFDVGNEVGSFDFGFQYSSSPLVKLDLSDNELCSIPDDINELSDLEDLVLSNNKLQEVPSTCFGIATLRVLRLDGNNELRLEGDIAATNDISVLRQYFETLYEVTAAFEMTNMREHAVQRDKDLTHELYECLQLPHESTEINIPPV